PYGHHGGTAVGGRVATRLPGRALARAVCARGALGAKGRLGPRSGSLFSRSSAWRGRAPDSRYAEYGKSMRRRGFRELVSRDTTTGRAAGEAVQASAPGD